MSNTKTGEKTLSQTLYDLGYTHGASNIPGKREIMRGPSVIFIGTAAETWQWLRDRGAVR